MLKSTYRTAPAAASTPLPPGWTEHKAPTGHTYYYNAETKQSTYTRPAAEPEELLIDYEAKAPDQVIQASFKVLDEFHKNNPDTQRGQGQFTGGRGYQDRSRRDKRQDRPKSKKVIANCEPWILVMTKFGRRFVHNTETKESFWKFPSEVMMAVIEMERAEWEEKKKTDESKAEQPTSENVAHATASTGDKPNGQPQDEEYDSEEYEEVEVTDDEDEADPSAKRQRTGPDNDDESNEPKGPVEYDEDDIAWQLAQMDDEGYDMEGQDEDLLDEEDEGLPLTNDDSIALFRSLLDEMRISPYSNFDALIEGKDQSIVEDTRWVTLPSMASRREAFATWSRDRVAEQKAQEAASAATSKDKKRNDPRIAYLSFLQDNATPKLYWPEFKRKFKREAVMKDLNLPDKDREKLYREYITKIKAGEEQSNRDLRTLLESIPRSDSWNSRTRLDDLPVVLLRDLRFYTKTDRKGRDEMVQRRLKML